MTSREDVIAACRAADEAADDAKRAADDVLAHSVLWLTVHPFTRRRLRGKLRARRAAMEEAVRVMHKTARDFYATREAGLAP